MLGMEQTVSFKGNAKRVYMVQRHAWSGTYVNNEWLRVKIGL